MRASVPVRVADVGGWTDTWFGSPGRVCSLAVGPGVVVDASVVTGRSPGAALVRLIASVDDTSLLDHAVDAVVEDLDLTSMLEDGDGIDVTISSSVPPGASLGTSASVVVGVLGALDSLVGGGARLSADLAVLAHEVEVTRAGREAGVQDQWAAALGGAGLMAIAPYPTVRHERLAVPHAALHEIGSRLVTVVFGPHDSSAVHGEVINAMVGCGGEVHDRARRALAHLSALAGDAAEALLAGDVERWAAVLTASTEGQAALHTGLVGRAHREAIDLASAHGASGWKVNGAGGEGGSLTVVASPQPGAVERLASALDRGGWQVVDLAPAVGLVLA